MAKTFLASQRRDKHELEKWAQDYRECVISLHLFESGEMHSPWRISFRTDTSMSWKAMEDLDKLDFVIQKIHSIPPTKENDERLGWILVRRYAEK